MVATSDKDNSKAKEILDKCVQCGSCLSVCPVFKVRSQEKFTPRGKLYYLQQSEKIENEPSLKKAYADTIFSCTACGLCTDICDSDVSLLDIFYTAKNEYIDQKPVFNALRQKTTETGNIFGMENSMRTILWLDEVEDVIRDDFEEKRVYEEGKTAEVCFFLGCLASFKSTQMKSLVSTLKIFERFNVDYLVLGEEEYCCGHPYTLIGKNEEAQRLRKQNSSIFRKGKFKKIITNCPGCLASIAKYHNIDSSVKVLHLTEFLNDLIKSEDIVIPLSDEVDFHFPCELYLVNGVTDAPIRLLKKVGLEVNQLDLSCCGGGGVLRVNDPDLSSDVLKNKLEEQKIDGKKGLITCCPACVEQFDYGNVTVYDVSVYVERATKKSGEYNDNS